MSRGTPRGPQTGAPKALRCAPRVHRVSWVKNLLGVGVWSRGCCVVARPLSSFRFRAALARFSLRERVDVLFVLLTVHGVYPAGEVLEAGHGRQEHRVLLDLLGS